MELTVDTSSKEPIYRQLALQIREGAARGLLSSGEKLPSVRELSRRLVVNPNTIAKAYTELERDGVLHTRQGMGVFVAKPCSELSKSACRKRIVERIDTVLTEAVYLGFTQDEILSLTRERSEQFKWEQ